LGLRAVWTFRRIEKSPGDKLSITFNLGAVLGFISLFIPFVERSK